MLSLIGWVPNEEDREEPELKRRNGIQQLSI